MQAGLPGAHQLPLEPVELVYGQVSARCPSTTEVEGVFGGQGPATKAGGRTVLDAAGTGTEAASLRRGRLGAELRGPLLIEEDDSTTWIPPGWAVRDGPHGVLTARRTAT